LSQRVPDEARLGTFLAGGLRLDSILGRGGFGVVYGGVYANGTNVAVKVLRGIHAKRPEVLARFEREAEVLTLLAGAGAPRIVDRGVAPDGCPFLVFERSPGASLAQVLQERRALSYLQVRSIVEQVLDVLARAHAQGIVHRDLKPGNLLYGPDARVTVLDFGVAMDVVGKQLTAQDEAVGTFAYMPPEQAIGARVETGPPSDIFSLGATALTLLAGRPVRKVVLGESPPAFPSVYELGIEAPRSFLDVLARAVSYAPEERYADGTAMRDALRDSERTFMDDATEVGGAPPEVVHQRLLAMREKERLARDLDRKLAAPGHDRFMLAPEEGRLIAQKLANVSRAIQARSSAHDWSAEAKDEARNRAFSVPAGKRVGANVAEPVELPVARVPWRALAIVAFVLIAVAGLVAVLGRH
jgi:serine/threonine protein kinase